MSCPARPRLRTSGGIARETPRPEAVTVIVDASVALKWVIEEPGADAALALVADETLAAPDLLFIECANVLWVKVRRGQLSMADAKAALAAIEATPIRTIPTRLHVTAAQAIAFDLGQTAYDSLYLAAAVAEQAMLVTADDAFAAAAAAHALYRPLVRQLGV